MAKREVARELLGVFTPLHNSKPMTEIEALMLTPPGEEPELSVMELQPLREAVAECIEQLDEQDVWILDAVMSERVSLEALAKRMGITKTHVWRLRNKAFDKLERIMVTHPIIRRRIRVADTWEQAAGQWVTFMSDTANDPQELEINKLQSMRDNAAVSIKAEQAPSFHMWTAIAAHAINHLRFHDKWDAGEMLRVLCAKQHDYGHGNINKFGLIGVLVRLSDKIERYANLVNRTNAVPNETVIDTVMDMVGYCVVAQMLNDHTFDLKLGANWNKENQ